ncbi:MAG: PASTA domain-containing protein [Mycobacteriaceae bacterium]
MPEQLPPAVLDLWRDTPTGAPPVDEIIRAGQRARARRRGLTVGLSAATVAAIAAGAVLLAPAGSGGDVDEPSVAAKPSATSHPFPADMRLFGYAGVTVAVPRSWVVNTAPCGTPDRPFIGFASRTPRSCPRLGEPAVVSALGVGAPEVMGLASDGWEPATSDAGVRYEHSAVTCADGRCEQAYRLPGRDVAFALSVTDSDKKLLRTLPASLAPLPTGRVAVPYFDPGADLAHVTDLLRSAGLRAVVDRTTAQPLVPVSSSPAPGTVVPSGSKITVLMD